MVEVFILVFCLHFLEIISTIDEKNCFVWPFIAYPQKPLSTVFGIWHTLCSFTGSLFGLFFFLVLAGSYVKRLQRFVCARYYPQREKVRQTLSTQQTGLGFLFLNTLAITLYDHRYVDHPNMLVLTPILKFSSFAGVLQLSLIWKNLYFFKQGCGITDQLVLSH